jgi:hypothetical protein
MLATDMSVALDPSRLMLAAGMKPDEWQKALLRERADNVLLLCSRQAGKSTGTAAVAVWESLYNAPALILLLSPSQRQSQELFRKVMDFYHALGAPIKPKSESTLQLELENGSRIVALPGKEETVRGYSGARLLVIDEASRVPDALYYGVRPMLAVSGGRIICLTTPFGKRGFFFDAWNKEGEAWQRHKVTANDVPRISREFLNTERAAVGEWWYSQEYMCEFRETTDQVFAYDLVMAAISHDVKPLEIYRG